MLRIARAALLVTGSIYVGAFGAGVSGLIDPAAAMLLGIYSGIGLEIAAAACVVTQILSFRRRR